MLCLLPLMPFTPLWRANGLRGAGSARGEGCGLAPIITILPGAAVICRHQEELARLRDEAEAVRSRASADIAAAREAAAKDVAAAEARASRCTLLVARAAVAVAGAQF